MSVMTEISNEMFKLGVERSDEIVFMTDKDGNIIYANPMFTKVYGFTPEEALGKTPRIIKSGTLAPEIYQQFWETLFKKEIVAGEIVNKTKDGRLLTIEGSANPIINSEGNIVGFLAVQRDITGRKKLEGELKKKVHDLETFNQVAVGRELKMAELKKNISRLEEELKKARGG